MEKKKYKIIERTFLSGEKEYVVKQRFMFWFWVTHREDMGMYIEHSIFDDYEGAEGQIKFLTARDEARKQSKVKSIREI